MTFWKAAQVFVVSLYVFLNLTENMYVFLNLTENIKNQEVGSFALEHCTAIAYTQLNDDRMNKRENQTQLLQ